MNIIVFPSAIASFITPVILSSTSPLSFAPDNIDAISRFKTFLFKKDAGYLILDTGLLISRNQYLVSSNQHPASSIQYPASSYLTKS